MMNEPPVFDVHQYLDENNSGTTAGCTKDGIDVAFRPLANWLKSAKRQALLSEIGGGSNDQSCITNVCAALDFLNENHDVFLGYVGWAAGSFQTTYVLSLVPVGNNDVPLVAKCFAAKFDGGAGSGNDTSTPPSSPVPVSSAAAISGARLSSDMAGPLPAASSGAPAGLPVGGGSMPSIGGGSASPATSAAPSIGGASQPIGGGSPLATSVAAAAPTSTISPASLPSVGGGSVPTLSVPVTMSTGTAVSGAAAPTGTGYLIHGGSGYNSTGPAGWPWTGQQGAGKKQGGVGTCKNKKGGSASQKMKKRRGRARKARLAYEEDIDG